MTTALESPAAVSRAQRLWAVLLVLDSFFVIIFGGALAAKLYQHWHSPPAPQRRAARAPKETPTRAADKPAPAKAQAPKSEPKATEPAPPAPAKAETAANKPLAKPSLLQEAPKRRETPTLKNGSAHAQGTATTATTTTPATPAKAAEAAPAASAAKAIPTEFKLKTPGAKSVELAGAFLVRTGGVKAMLRRDGDLWTLRLYLTPNTYRYHFLVDGKKTLDPENSQSDKGYSVLTVAPQ